jgi:DNA-damage-inducible protein D
MNIRIDSIIKELDSAKRLSKRGGEYWMGRDIQKILGYSNWVNFKNVIDKARMACASTGVDDNNHFADVNKVVKAGSGAMVPTSDCFLTRYACYLIAMNGDASKAEIGIAQSYFAIQARRQEMQDQLTDSERRLQLRDRVRNANKSLMSTAKKAGVQRYAIFQDAGYQGLYEMGLADIKRKKGLAEKENLLDRAGRTELAANEFRITQTEEKIIRDNIDSEIKAISTHREVGREVRNVINRIGGTMPENLPAEEPIKRLMSKKRKEVKEDVKKIME